MNTGMYLVHLIWYKFSHNNSVIVFTFMLELETKSCWIFSWADQRRKETSEWKHVARQRLPVWNRTGANWDITFCLWVQADGLTMSISQTRPAHSESYWHALIKRQGRREAARSAGLSNQREEGAQGYCTSTRVSSTWIQRCCAEMPLHKCQLTVNHRDDGYGLFNVTEGFVWSHSTAWVITAIISKSVSFRVIMAMTVMQ